MIFPRRVGSADRRVDSRLARVIVRESTRKTETQKPIPFDVTRSASPVSVTDRNSSSAVTAKSGYDTNRHRSKDRDASARANDRLNTNQDAGRRISAAPNSLSYEEAYTPWTVDAPMYAANSIPPSAAMPTKNPRFAAIFQFLDRTYSPMPRQKQAFRSGR